MSRYYLDASALVKRYVDEAGSNWLRAAIHRASSPLLLTSRLTILEVTGAFARRLREGTLTRQECAAVRDTFRSDCLNEYQIMPPTVAVIELGCDLLERHMLRAYDAAHLATALSAQAFLTRRNQPALTFLSADDRLNHAASVEGLNVDNPNVHP